MDKQAAIRRARILVSVFFGLLAVALCVMWVRSYHRTSFFGWSVTRQHHFTINSEVGRLSSSLHYNDNPNMRQGLAERDIDSDESALMQQLYAKRGALGFRANGTRATVPHWFAVLACAIVAAAPWVSTRFSLRTMLLATTLVAGVLGLGVWLIR